MQKSINKKVVHFLVVYFKDVEAVRSLQASLCY